MARAEASNRVVPESSSRFGNSGATSGKRWSCHVSKKPATIRYDREAGSKVEKVKGTIQGRFESRT